MGVLTNRSLLDRSARCRVVLPVHLPVPSTPARKSQERITQDDADVPDALQAYSKPSTFTDLCVAVRRLLHPPLENSTHSRLSRSIVLIPCVKIVTRSTLQDTLATLHHPTRD